MSSIPGAFTTVISGIPLTGVDDKNGTYAYPNWITPAEFQAMGYPADIQSTFDYFKPTNVSCTYYASLKGQMGGFSCSCIYQLISQILTSNNTVASGPNIIWQNSKKDNDSYFLDTVDMPLKTDTPHNIPYRINTFLTDIDNKSGCNVCGSPSFDEVELTIKVFVQINLDVWCITPNQNYMHDDMCFTYFSDKGAKAKMQDDATTNYLVDYCARNYPGAQLDAFYKIPPVFDSKDYQLCACNMPANEYIEFKSSVTGSDPQFGPWSAECLFSPCYSSNFKPSRIAGCPNPDCINITSINGSTINGDVDINQSAECSNVQSGQTAPTGQTAPEQEQTFIQKYGWIIIVVAIVFFLLALVIGGGAYAYSSMSKGSKSTMPIKVK